MNREIISDKQGLAIVVIFIAGTSSILSLALEAEKDAWLAIILGIIMGIIESFILIRLNILFMDKDLFDICEICFGKFLSKIFILLFTWFVFEEASQTIINNSQLIKDTALPETPMIVPRVVLLFLCVWAVREGIELIGKWSSFFIIPFIVFVFSSVLLLINKMDINNMLPILDKGIKPVLKGAYSSFTFPFGEIIILSLVFSRFKTKQSYYNVYILGLLIGGVCALVLSLSTILVISPTEALQKYYSAYSTSARIDIGDFIQRLEILSSLVFVIGGFLKISILLLASSIGFSKLFNLNDYRFIIIPISLLILNLSFISFDNRIEFVDWNSSGWLYYSFLFEVILPIIILIVAEMKKLTYSK
ncbi:GerAB/ArcD/ProY family transporter [Tepidibacter formicigenes]|uniref:Spore germination protein KB n=1 Tax=Tepidibacter formicigenes DSM 15518 TaxID=1123349 RepID=A0A1M6NSJ4_9FIRM|nr:endospore germination permease [Tepidibacter formicigenes]SHJ98618.1 spore germination protein KB [Tepidibacter formicigenes DSM 15518]